MGVKDRQRKQRRQRQKKSIWQGNGSSILPELANAFNTIVQCAWCGEPATLYTSMDDEEPPSAVGLRISSLYVAVHHGCMEAVQTALRNDDKSTIDRLSRFPAPDLFGGLATRDD